MTISILRNANRSVAIKLLLGLAVLLTAPLAVAQNNLGELLDAGAKKLSADEFKKELVQRAIVGPTAAGGFVELIYISNGTIQGKGSHPLYPSGTNQLNDWGGEWKIDDSGNVCASMRVGSSYNVVALPYRCQAWFKYKDQYFLSDSDTDRHARVFPRTIKK